VQDLYGGEMKTIPDAPDTPPPTAAAPASVNARESERQPWPARLGRALLPPRRSFVAVAAAAGATAAVATAGAGAILAAVAGLLAGLAADSVLARPLGVAAAAPPEPAPPDAVAGRTSRAPLAARALVDALPTPLLAVSVSGRVVHANPAARTLFPRLVPGGHYAGLIRAPEFVAAVEAALAGGGRRSVSVAAAPGRERFLEARLSPLAENGGLDDEARLLVQIEDRTEARRAEQLRSDFIANASHELRTPLASIIGYIETLQNHARDDAVARERFLKIMGREAGRMQRLVDDLMSLSRIEMSEHVRPSAPCVVSDIAAEAAAALLPLAESEGIRLDVTLPKDGASVLGDRDQLYQVFCNLIDNAIKYAGPGATIRLTAAAPSLAFPSCAGVSVADDGPGIPREHLPRLTERFYRASVGQSRSRGGTGLGLAIVKHILNRHEGRLEIASIVGKGSTFTVWLPCRTPPESARPGRALAAPAQQPPTA
jgi:two-component system, OmpR family, phosphate regulon sensor histidine kinase PhoR